MVQLEIFKGFFLQEITVNSGRKKRQNTRLFMGYPVVSFLTLPTSEMPVHFLVFFCSGAGTSAQRSPARDTPEVTQYTGERWVSSPFRGFQRAKGENFSGTYRKFQASLIQVSLE